MGYEVCGKLTKTMAYLKMEKNCHASEQNFYHLGFYHKKL